MKQITWIILLAAVLGLFVTSGCEGINNDINDFRETYPDASLVAVDEDGDGLPETYMADIDGDGIPDGEVPGVRDKLAASAQLDDMAAVALPGVGALFGPAVGGICLLIGGLWGRLKPAKRALFWQGVATEVIDSVQEYRNGLNTSEKAKMSEVMDDNQTTATKNAVNDVKVSAE